MAPYRDDTEAHRLYAEGRYYWNKRTEDGLRKAIASFYQALDSEPTYARAWAGLADAYHQLGVLGTRTTNQCLSQRKERCLEGDRI